MGKPDQARDGHGRWTSEGGAGDKKSSGLSAWAEHVSSQLAPKLVDTAEKQGGFTMKASGFTPKTGLMVSRHPDEGHGHVVEIAKMLDRDPRPTAEEAHRETVAATKEWLKKALPAIRKLGRDHYLGGWMEKGKDGSLKAMHLDVSQRFEPRHKERAIAAGRERNQIAIWDIGKQREIPTGGTGR